MRSFQSASVKGYPASHRASRLSISSSMPGTGGAAGGTITGGGGAADELAAEPAAPCARHSSHSCCVQRSCHGAAICAAAALTAWAIQKSAHSCSLHCSSQCPPSGMIAQVTAGADSGGTLQLELRKIGMSPATGTAGTDLREGMSRGNQVTSYHRIKIEIALQGRIASAVRVTLVDNSTQNAQDKPNPTHMERTSLIVKAADTTLRAIGIMETDMTAILASIIRELETSGTMVTQAGTVRETSETSDTKLGSDRERILLKPSTTIVRKFNQAVRSSDTRLRVSGSLGTSNAAVTRMAIRGLSENGALQI